MSDSPCSEEVLIEEIAPGFTREWHCDRQIIVYVPTSATRQMVDWWLDTAIQTALDWEGGKPYLAMHDLSHPDVVLTPYARQRTREAVRKLPDYLARSATVVTPSVMGHIMKLFVAFDMRKDHPSLERKVFFARRTAFRWLMEKLGALT